MTKFSPDALTLSEKRAALKALREAIKAEVAMARALKADAAVAKAEAKADKVAAQIAKAQAKLQKLMDKASAPVGAKAIKANRKPSKAVVYGAEDNAIAAAIMAKKASA